ncbi:MAG TPA: response regulator transcription factor [Noviherbaspirillum sp.]|uniref:response regulator transcription factor n=1 Tax=Noviherbaspirillum sp. TaxID=1926288 RepID=UPI002D4928BF|nr:response regulator transcription factor [Noviherbaspirillum sp.]HYD94210.1 response regulator transcription factor [Noviherbaspirillum sp.]
MRIAILDNDKDQAAAIRGALAAAGYRCELARNREALLHQLQHGEADLVVLDCASTDGQLAQLVEACTAAAAPVLLVAARAEEDDIVAGMIAGASDCVVKPVRRGELATRVRALQRRFLPAPPADAGLHVGPYRFDIGTARVSKSGKTMDLTRKEFELALLFFRHLGRPLSRAYIRESVWPNESEFPSRTMDTHVSRVRSKLGLRAENGFRLTPVYSFGYQLEQLR